MDNPISKEKKFLFLFVIICFFGYLFIAYIPYLFGDKSPIFNYLNNAFFYDYPRWGAVHLYLIVIASFILGYFLPFIFKIKFPKLREAIGSKFKDKTIKLIFIFYGISILANILGFIFAQGVPLLNIEARYHFDPKLSFLANLQYIFIQIIFIWSIAKKNKKIPIILFLISFILLSLLSTRHSVFRLVISTLITFFIFDKKIFKKTLVPLLIGLILVFLVVGLISKSLIYKEKYPLSKIYYAPLQLAFTDSLNSFQYLDVLKTKVDKKGQKNGKILKESLTSTIPGTSAEYANYRVGEIITNKNIHKRVYGDEIIKAPISLSTTMAGPFYADFKYFGIIVFPLILGFLFSVFLSISLVNIKFLFILIPFIFELLISIYAGTYGPATVFVVVAVIISIFYYIFKIKNQKNIA